MVFQSLTLFARSRGPDEFWRKRKIFKLAAHFVGRKRNCYSIAIRYVHRALRYATMSRKLKKADMLNLWNTRLTAACAEHDINLRTFKEALMRNNILIDRKTLVDLAIWEPRSFKSLTQLAIARGKQDGLNDVMYVKTPPGVITRGMLK
ncbi:large ribosomal subunit protein bL20m [Neodiprion pinetum]|uniref:Large ribosomal subunit protein bL20m n=1 Tax=Neodiprion lecontei TaxID=441921 RepID=A0A6J0B4W9_NEOLC|nr:39S ribosomal protein L20, mitochondrial [Neodiprion lecontei]XP_046480576.1 39S ribosomal protein L20, mitochondrial [Neodiprion pinetum]